ncbi:MAG: hypothetical protein KF773_25785 [Deltaproteobacteria bacterium]|nr:hypothetical protein [Deltaproteobacteria bacterium]
MKLRLRCGVIAATLVTMGAAARADDEDKVDATDAAPEPAAPPVVRPAAPAPEKFTWEPWGYLRLQYIAVQNDPNVEFIGRDDGFELLNVRVGVRGTLAGRATYMIAFDGAVDERDRVNVPDGKLRVGLRDAFTDVALSKTMVVRAGLFRTSTDTEPLLEIHRLFVDRGLESRGMRATEGFETRGLTAGRSLGAALRVEPGREAGSTIGFEVAIQNGADELASNNNNDKPAISAALLFRTHDGDGLVPNGGGKLHADLQIAGRFNPRTAGDLPFRQDENDLQAIVNANIGTGRFVLGAGAVFQRTTFPSVGGPDSDAFGAHAQAMVSIGTAERPFSIGYRFGILDPSSLVTTDRVMEHTAAAVVGVPRLRMRFLLQGTHVIEQVGRELSNDRVQLAAELTL